MKLTLPIATAALGIGILSATPASAFFFGCDDDAYVTAGYSSYGYRTSPRYYRSRAYRTTYYGPFGLFGAETEPIVVERAYRPRVRHYRHRHYRPARAIRATESRRMNIRGTQNMRVQHRQYLTPPRDRDGGATMQQRRDLTPGKQQLKQ